MVFHESSQLHFFEASLLLWLWLLLATSVRFDALPLPTMRNDAVTRRQCIPEFQSAFGWVRIFSSWFWMLADGVRTYASSLPTTMRSDVATRRLAVSYETTELLGLHNPQAKRLQRQVVSPIATFFFPERHWPMALRRSAARRWSRTFSRYSLLVLRFITRL